MILDDSTYAVDPPHYGAYPLVDAFESVAEMEKALGMPEGVLQETLRNYNAHAERGEDPDLQKGKK